MSKQSSTRQGLLLSDKAQLLLVPKAVNVAGLQGLPLGPGVINPHDAVEVASLPLIEVLQ